MVFRSVGTLVPAIVVYNGRDIGPAFDGGHKHQSREFSLEQDSPFCRGVQNDRESL